jgi:hypothetical protein
MRAAFLFFALSMGLVMGCEDSASNKAPAPSATPPADVKKPAAAPAPAPSPVPSTETAQPSTPSAAAPSANTPDTPPPGMVSEKADVGSGEKGRGYGEGFIATPIATYFAARERISFTIQIPELIRAYKFEHDMKGPKSHDEFMKQIIGKYGIDLPRLPPGQKYWYDAENEQLNVLRPK